VKTTHEIFPRDLRPAIRSYANASMPVGKEVQGLPST
jgi:hypothetical protein